jgi:hypothetical protein
MMRELRLCAARVLFRTLLSAPVLLLVLQGCLVPDDPQDPRRRDMLMSGGGDGGAGDLAAVDMMRPQGAIGAACKTNADCKFGKAPACWVDHILNKPGNLATPGGYCSSGCASDADCAGQGFCTTVETGEPRHCVASCSGRKTCRDPGYACFVLSATSGYCYPDGRLTCNPTSGTGECAGPPPAACVRRAFDDKGECIRTCDIGFASCPDKQHCVYLNTTIDNTGRPTNDKFKGSACFPLYGDAKGENEKCSFFDECKDFLQCHLGPGGDGKCHYLCRVGVAMACTDPNQKCKDVFQAGLGNPGLCLPP